MKIVDGTCICFFVVETYQNSTHCCICCSTQYLFFNLYNCAAKDVIYFYVCSFRASIALKFSKKKQCQIRLAMQYEAVLILKVFDISPWAFVSIVHFSYTYSHRNVMFRTGQVSKDKNHYWLIHYAVWSRINERSCKLYLWNTSRFVGKTELVPPNCNLRLVVTTTRYHIIVNTSNDKRHFIAQKRKCEVLIIFS